MASKQIFHRVHRVDPVPSNYDTFWPSPFHVASDSNKLHYLKSRDQCTSMIKPAARKKPPWRYDQITLLGEVTEWRNGPFALRRLQSSYTILLSLYVQITRLLIWPYGQIALLQIRPYDQITLLSILDNIYLLNQYCEVFQAVTSSFFANTYRPRALFLANTSGRGPIKITAGRQLGLVQIRIALQEVCYVIDH